ncbi:MAG: hypothetical protein JSV44_00630 [Candidatus Zixiibacteriota bacterium]|nr:MAG: hypothetical protein JSV44_00630 [candidate division Zixibacteria bacterium]
MRKYRKLVGLLSAIAILLITWGCFDVITGTFVVSYRFGSADVNTYHDDFAMFYVDLTKESEWQKRKDDIKNIDNIGFELWITNNGLDPVTGQLFAALDSSYADTLTVRSDARLVFSGLTLPGGDVQTYVDWPGSLGLLVDVDALKKFAEKGEFAIYALTTTLPFDITVDSATVIITFTAGE